MRRNRRKSDSALKQSGERPGPKSTSPRKRPPSASMKTTRRLMKRPTDQTAKAPEPETTRTGTKKSADTVDREANTGGIGRKQKTHKRPTTTKATRKKAPVMKAPGKKPRGKKPTGKKPTSKAPTSKKPRGKKPTSKKPRGKRPTGNTPTGKRLTSKTPTSKAPTSKKPTGRKAPAKKATNNSATGTRSAAGKRSATKKTKRAIPKRSVTWNALQIPRSPPPEFAPSSASLPVGPSPKGAVDDQIRELEARLDTMIRRNTREPSDVPPSIGENLGTVAREVVDRLPPLERPGSDDGSVVDAARELISSDYYLRQWGRLGMRHRSEEVDDFGLDPTYEQRIRPFQDFLYKQYFRTETQGIDNVPDTGRAVIVSNHSGTLPLDGMMLRTALRLEHRAERELRWLAEDFIYYLPFVGAFMNRIGAVRACQENAERLLTRKEALVAVFPEGVKGIGKLYRERYRLQRFGRGGFIRLCLRTGTPLLPCAIVGAEEANPMFYRVESVAKAFGLPYIPITATFPWLGPAGLLPAPTKWKIRFGEKLDFAEYGPDAAEDDVLVGRLADRVRASIQEVLDETTRRRKSVWFG